MLRSHVCCLNSRLAEPTNSQLDHGYKAGVQMWSSAADKFDTDLIRSPAHLKLRSCWTALCIKNANIWDVLVHLLCQSFYRFNTGPKHLNQLHVLFFCKHSCCLFQFYIFVQKNSLYMWVIDKAANSTVWYDCLLIVMFRLSDFIKICRIQVPSIIPTCKVPAELILQ